MTDFNMMSRLVSKMAMLHYNCAEIAYLYIEGKQFWITGHEAFAKDYGRYVAMPVVDAGEASVVINQATLELF